MKIAAGRPPALIVALVALGIEIVALGVLGVLEFASYSSDRPAVSVTTGLFFVGYAGALGWCLLGAWHGSSWARSPIILAQLMQLGVAWSFRGGETTQLAIALAAVALVVGVGLLLPASLAALADPADPTDTPESTDPR